MYTDRTKGSMSFAEDPHSARRDEEEPRAGVRWGKWAAILLIAAGFAALCWYGYAVGVKQRSLLEDWAALRGSFASMGDRMTKAEADLHSWWSSQQALQARVDALENGLGARFRAVQKGAREMTDAAYARLNGQFNGLSERMERRMTSVESAQASDQTTLASLESQVAAVKQEMQSQASKLAALQQQNAGEQDVVEQRLAGLDRSVDGNAGELVRLARKVDTRRVDFELEKGRSRELAPGISIRVTGTDVAYRRLKGWMWIMPDRKTIWLRDQAVQQPVIFYSEADGRRREVVFTRVGKHSAVGYLLLPAAPDAG